LGGGKYIPVRGTIGSIEFEANLVPRGRGAHRMFVHSRVWRALGLSRGATFSVTLSRSAERTEPPMPSELRRALERRPAAARAFAALAPGLQREVQRWLTAAKRPETRERRLEVGLERIEERYRRRRR